MPQGLLPFLRSFRDLAPASDSDGALLERFFTARDELAFATLVRRHGDVVYGMARRLALTPDDADDIFQAAFLVLARRGRRLTRWPSVAGWLVEVTRRVALQARAKAHRRTRHESQVAMRSPHALAPPDSAAAHELAELLDHELARLPLKYRTPWVLCQLQGYTKEEAAARLGWPAGTISGRLARARKLIASRLLRRGVTPAAVMAAVSAVRLDAATSPLLVQATTLLATTVVLQGSKITSRPVVLASGVLSTMLIKKWSAVALVLLSLGLLNAAILAGGTPDDLQTPNLPAARQNAAGLTTPDAVLAQLQGEWVTTSEPAFRTVIWRFDGNKVWTSTRQQEVQWPPQPRPETGPKQPYVFSLKTDKRPFEYELASSDPVNSPRHQIHRGILELTHGKLQLAMHIAGSTPTEKERTVPSDFTPEEGKLVTTFRRRTDYDRLEGIWLWEQRHPVTNEVTSAEELIFRGNQYVSRHYTTLRRTGQLSYVSESPVMRFELDESKRPKWIDLEVGAALTTERLPGDRAYERYFAVYELVPEPAPGQRLIIHRGAGVPYLKSGDGYKPDPTQPLPKRPTTLTGEGELIRTYRRVDRAKKGTDLPNAEGRTNRMDRTRPGSTRRSTGLDVPADQPRLTELRREKVSLTRQRFEELTRSGASAADLDAASWQLTESQLALATTTAGRISALERHLTFHKEQEQQFADKVKAGKAAASDLTTLKLKRVDVEIRLEEAKAGQDF